MSLEQHGKIKKSKQFSFATHCQGNSASICLMYCDVSHKASFEKKGGWAVLLKEKIINISETKSKAAVG